MYLTLSLDLFRTFPERTPNATTISLDGALIVPDSLPGGVPPLDLCLAAIHEVSHWPSLFHTFQLDPNVSPARDATG
ncbi:hypothetical protein BJX64DRAFT_251068 [Aspergillus heterothallicus]